jgi:FkbM family methyltransferase
VKGAAAGMRAGIARRLHVFAQIAWLRNLALQHGVKFSIGWRYVTVTRGKDRIRLARRNFVYALDLIRNFDYYFNVVVPEQRGAMRIADFSAPKLQTMQEDGLQFWFPSMPESMETTRLYLDAAGLKPGQVVVDAGAYAGGSSYHFSTAVGPTGRVIALEPDRGNFECLTRNIALHRMTNVQAVKAGLWSSTGEIGFQSEGNMGSAVSEVIDRRGLDDRVQVYSLADLCARFALQRLDFVKLDVEGSEVAILAAAGEVMARLRPRFAIEVHNVDGEITDRKVGEILSANRYQVKVVPQAGLPVPLLFAFPPPE